MQALGLPYINMINPEFLVGVYAFYGSQWFLQSLYPSLSDQSWLLAYVATMFTGVGLSIIVGLISLILMLGLTHKQRCAKVANPSVG